MDKIDKIIIRLQGIRKWSVMILIVLVGIVFRLMNLISGAEMVDLYKATAIAFFSSNAIEHAKNFFQNKLLK